MSMFRLSQFTVLEKLYIMQSIREDLRGHIDPMAVPASHREILDERRRRVDEGEAKLRDWDLVKHTIGWR